MSTDPLGLTPEQRAMSNVYAGLSHREVWWPREIDPRVIEGELVGEPDDSITLVATVLHNQGFELEMQAVPKP